MRMVTVPLALLSVTWVLLLCWLVPGAHAVEYTDEIHPTDRNVTNTIMYSIESKADDRKHQWIIDVPTSQRVLFVFEVFVC